MTEADDTAESEEHFKNAISDSSSGLGKGSDDPFTNYYLACL